jgi:hypothetical protein
MKWYGMAGVEIFKCMDNGELVGASNFLYSGRRYESVKATTTTILPNLARAVDYHAIRLIVTLITNRSQGLARRPRGRERDGKRPARDSRRLTLARERLRWAGAAIYSSSSSLMPCSLAVLLCTMPLPS